MKTFKLVFYKPEEGTWVYIYAEAKEFKAVLARVKKELRNLATLPSPSKSQWQINRIEEVEKPKPSIGDKKEKREKLEHNQRKHQGKTL